MNKDYIISINADQSVDGSNSKVQLTTVGSYAHKGSIRYIIYNEYDEDYPGLKITSIIKVEHNKVTLIRNNVFKSRLILEKGKRHQCFYSSNGMSMMMGVFTKNIISNLDDNGGKLEITYSLDINTDVTSFNHIVIDVKKGD